VLCSDNTKDFAQYDRGQNRHVIHPDISEEFPIPVKFYRSLPVLIEEELGGKVAEEEARLYEQATLETRAVVLPPPRAAKGLYFERLDRQIDQAKLLALDWFARRYQPTTSNEFELTFRHVSNSP
jgi:hypothetical protein